MTSLPATATERTATSTWLLDRVEALCRADTTTGREDHGLPALRSLLRQLGAAVELQPVAPGRHNVLATWGVPRLLFSTHLDTVPPFVPPTRQGDTLHGRGTCDAKGQIVAQLSAIAELLGRGHHGLAWLGLVGEETDSAGAIAAVDLAPRLQTCVAAINGGPTENRLATGQRGALHLRFVVKGVAAHSGLPELGRSAVWPLLDWLQRLREVPLAVDPVLGAEVWNVGSLHAGGAVNVVASHAEAHVLVRTVPDSNFLRHAIELAPTDGEVQEVSATPADRFTQLPGFEHAVAGFCSDAPQLRRLVGGQRVVMCGPGSTKVAHTLEERITGNELLAGRDQLTAVAGALLRAART